MEKYLKYIYLISATIIVLCLSQSFVAYQNKQVSKLAYQNPRLITVQKIITVKTIERTEDSRLGENIESRLTRILADGTKEILEKGIKKEEEKKSTETTEETKKEEKKEDKTPVALASASQDWSAFFGKNISEDSYCLAINRRILGNFSIGLVIIPAGNFKDSKLYLGAGLTFSLF